jgi:NADP-reducing hydrogenase subunit HndB
MNTEKKDNTRSLSMKLKPEDLDKISQRMKATTILREGAGRAKITVHMGTCGIAAGARDILSAFLKSIEESKADDIILTTSGCAGLCSREPMATIELKGKPPVKYVDLTKEKVERIFKEHVQGGEVVAEYALAIGSERVS